MKFINRISKRLRGLFEPPQFRCIHCANFRRYMSNYGECAKTNFVVRAADPADKCKHFKQ